MELQLSETTLALIKGLRKDATTTGITTGTGLNFYHLEPVARNIYPVFYPLLASTPRVNPMFGGMKVGGTATNWKAIIGIDSAGYPATSEGNRNAFMNIQEKDYSSAFKFLGKDIQTSFQAQSAGMGFQDNVALSQLSLLNALLNDEERMLLYGNSGTAGNGYVLGTCGTPVAALASGGTIADATTVKVFCVALTPWGAQLATSTGVTLPYLRTNADASTDTINGGTSVISAVSNGVVTSVGTGKQAVTATVTTINGAVAYAWYVNGVDGTTANAKFAFTTPYPTATFTALPAGGNQAGNAQSATVAGAPGNLTADHSFNTLDFDGMLTWTFGAAGAAQPSYVKDLLGAGFTGNGDGTIKEFEDVLDFLWKNYKITVDKIYVGGTLISAISKAILASSTGGAAAARITFESDKAGALVGGTKVVQYRSKYSNTGAAKVLDVITHPWLPDGVVYFDLINNPYPAAGGSIPAVRRIVSLEDHFSIKWPYRKLQHELGVYCFETVENYIPFGSAVITGAANKVN